jgi:hypothetical protein
MAPNSADHDEETEGKKVDNGGLATSPLNPITGSIEPLDGPLDRAGTEIEDDKGMTNKPIPLGDDEPEVGLTTPVED